MQTFLHWKTIQPLYIHFCGHCPSVITGKGCSRLTNHIRKYHNNKHNKVLSFAVMLRVKGSSHHKHTGIMKAETRCIIECNALGPSGLN